VRQEKLLGETDWDLLIILDACRYDYFGKIYPEYLEGELKKAVSPASNTMEWCQKVVKTGIFEDDVIVSANPHINSRMPVGEREFEATNYFKEIHDAWFWAWDEENKTVQPNEVTERSLDILSDCSERAIIWYIQPHAPYVTCPLKRRKNPFPKPREKRPMQIGGGEKNIIGKAMEFGVKQLLSPQLMKLAFKLRLKIRGDNAGLGPVRETFLEYGLPELRRFYAENLGEVLSSCRKACDEFPDKNVVITADHGELLGEYTIGPCFAHPARVRKRELVEVPWLEVDGVAR